MSKLLCTIILLILCLQVVIAQKTTATEQTLAFMLLNQRPEYLNAVGTVKSIQPETFNLKKVNGKWIEGTKFGNKVINFNVDKSKIEVVLYRDDAKIFRKEVYLIDSNHKLTNWDLYEANGSHSGTKTIYNYNKDGRVSDAIHYLLGSLSYKETFSYPAQNRFEVIRQFESHPNELSKEIYTYNAVGKITEVFFLDEDVKGREAYKYDKSGNRISHSVYSKSGSLLEKETYRYEFDKNGNWIKSIMTNYDPDKIESERKSVNITTRKIIYY
jgi:hypothetical protein